MYTTTISVKKRHQTCSFESPYHRVCALLLHRRKPVGHEYGFTGHGCGVENSDPRVTRDEPYLSCGATGV